MNSPYVRVAVAASAVVGLLLGGSATAAATPDSSGNKGGGKPSPAASGNANGGNSQGNSKGNSPGNSSSGGQGNSSASSQGNKPATAGKPATSPSANSQGNSQGNSSNSSGSNSNSANSGTKTLPDTASPVAQSAVNKDKTAAPLSPTTAPPAEDIAETVTPLPENAAENTATPPAASPQSNRDTAASGPAPARPATSLTPGAPPVPGSDGAESPGAAATAALTVPLSPSGATPEHGDSVATSVGKWLGDAATTIGREVRQALREVTLKDLALAALPGIAGLLFFLVTGVGLGHRQARFSFALETSGARLAPRGPLGLVGSDSLVRMHSATSTRRGTLRLVDRAA